MCYLFYALALLSGLWLPFSMSSGSVGLPIGMFWDTISLVVVIVPSYFLVATASGTLSFFNNNKYLEMWGEYALRMAYIGTVIGMVMICGSMGMPQESGVDMWEKLFASCAVALITILYGLIFKYMIIVPWLGCRHKDNSK